MGRNKMHPLEANVGFRRRRVVTWIIVGVSTLVIAPVLLMIVVGPMVLAWAAPGLVASQSEQIDGSMELESATFSWLGGTSLKGFRIMDRDGAVLIEANVESTHGIVALIRDRTDLGTLLVSGSANIERDENGVVNIVRALDGMLMVVDEEDSEREPTFPDARDARKEGVSLGAVLDCATLPGFSGKIVISELDLRYKDPALLEASGGAFDAVAIDGFGATGKIAADGATLTVRAKPFVELNGMRSEGLVTIDASVRGGLCSLAIDVESEAVELRVRAESDADSFSLVEPLSLTVRGAGYGPWLPHDGSLELSVWPELRVWVESFEAPKTGDRIDLDGARVVVTFESGRAEGVVRLADGGESAELRVKTAPILLRFESERLSDEVRVSGSGRAWVDGKEAGKFDVDLVGGGVVRDNTLVAAPSRLDGRVDLVGLSTALLQPFVGERGLDLSELIGQTLDVRLNADSSGGGAGDGLEIDVDLGIESAHARVLAPMRVGRREITSRGPILASHDSVGAALAMLIGKWVGFEAGGEGELRIDRFTVPIDGSTGKIDFAGLSAEGELGISGVAGEMREFGRVGVERAAITVGIAPGVPVRLGLKGDVVAMGEPVRLDGDWTGAGIDGLLSELGSGSVSWDGLALDGGLVIEGAGAVLAEIAGADWSQVVGELVGRDAKLRIETSSSGEDVLVRCVLDGAGVSMDFEGALVGGLASLRSIESRSLRATGRLSDAALQGVLGVVGNGFEARLATPAAFAVDVEPFSYGLGGEQEPAQVVFTLKTDATLLGAAYTDSDGSRRDVGDVSLREVVVRGGGFVGGVSPWSLDLAARVEDSTGGALGRVQVGVRGGVVENKKDDLTLVVTADKVSTEWLGPLVMPERPGVLGEMLGAFVFVDGTISRRSDGLGGLVLSLRSDRAETTDPIELVREGDVLKLVRPGKIRYRLEPGLVAELMMGDDGRETARLVEPVEVELTLRELSIGTGDLNPLDPAVFGFSGGIETGSIDLVLPSGDALGWSGLSVDVQRDPENARALQVNAIARESGTGAEVLIEGVVDRFADDVGRSTFQAARISGRVDAPDFPVAVVDAVSRQDGLLVDLLGETMSLRVQAEDLSMDSGRLSVRMDSPNAHLRLDGVANDGVFVLSDNSGTRIDTLTREMGQRINRRIPVLPGISKTPDQQEAMISTRGLVVPLDGNRRRLSGEVTIDPGVVTLTRTERLAKLLQVPRGTSIIGEKLEPLTLTIISGVVTMPRYVVPLGEFDIQLEGRFDLVQETVDMIVWVPMGNLTDELSSSINLGIGNTLNNITGSVLGEATLVPIRVQGLAKNPTYKPDVELMLRTLPNRLRPARNLLDAVEGGLKDILGGGD